MTNRLDMNILMKKKIFVLLLIIVFLAGKNEKSLVGERNNSLQVTNQLCTFVGFIKPSC